MLDFILPAIASALVALAISPLGRDRAARLGICASLLLLSAFALGSAHGHRSTQRFVLIGACLSAAAIIGAFRLPKA